MPPVFYLGRKKKSGLCPVQYVEVVFGFRVRRNLGIEVNSALWNSRYCVVNNSHPNSELINKTLDTIREKCRKVRLVYISEFKRPTKEEYLSEVFNIEVKGNFLQDFKKYIEQKRLLVKPNSYKIYNTTYLDLFKWNPNFNLTDSSIAEYIKKMLAEKLARSTINKRIGTLRIYAKEKGITLNLLISVKRNKAQKIYLTEAELELIYNLQLTGSREALRDLFYFACWTGMRYSDLKRFDNTFIQGDFIIFLSKKTTEKSVIPILKNAKLILDKYNGIPKPPSAKEANEVIKIICKQAGINQVVQVKKSKGLTDVVESAPKYKLVSMHTARHTFGTWLIDKGFSHRQVGMVLGQSKDSTVAIYDHANAEINAANILKTLEG